MAQTSSNTININLPSSKSISNRLLILNALSNFQLNIQNLSTADDTQILQQCLNSKENEVNVGMAGTAFRFLTAYYAISDREVVLTGNQRMLERPISPLVDALKQLGAEIKYLKKEGFPPLQIQGKDLEGGEIEIASNVSSQFVTALLLIAPKLKKGLNIKFITDVVSRPYIDMTIQILRKLGIKVHEDVNSISIESVKIPAMDMIVEPDWSAAAFFYNALVCSSSKQVIFFPNLSSNSLQGDSKLIEHYGHLGIHTENKDDGIEISKNGSVSTKEVFDFSDTPDLVQAFLVSCSVLQKKVHLSGVKTLKIKETDRISAMQNELKKIGGNLIVNSEDEISLMPSQATFSNMEINTYNDHRMAMAFAPLLFLNKGIKIKNKEVVSKSFPNFWMEIEKLKPHK